VAKRAPAKFTVKVVYAPSPDFQERLERIARLLLARYVKDMPPHKESDAGNKVEGEESRDH
jgi:hypothetical protein